MNKLSRIVMVFSAVVPASALATDMTEWQLDLYGPADPTHQNAVTVSQYLSFSGSSFIQNTFSDFTHFTFKDEGVFQATQVDGVDSIAALFSGYEMTALFKGATGTGTVGGTLSYTPGVGTLTFYSDNVAAGHTTSFGTSTPGEVVPPGDGIYYGANDGNWMGTFTVSSGSAFISVGTGYPNGSITIFLHATGLACNYWFSPSGQDLCVNPDLTLAITSVNATPSPSPSPTLVEEVIKELTGFTGSNYNNLPYNFVVANDGPFQLEQVPVPEPDTLALVGLGLAGLGIRRFRRV